MRELRIIIAGSRNFNDYNKLYKSIQDLLRDTEYFNVSIISGTARGADQLGERFAKEVGFRVYRFPADWEKLGRRAGYVRNSEMAKFAVAENNKSVLIAFWDGKSKGTKHMIDLAIKNNLEVHIVNF